LNTILDISCPITSRQIRGIVGTRKKKKARPILQVRNALA